jgi:hypothetical protein
MFTVALILQLRLLLCVAYEIFSIYMYDVSEGDFVLLSLCWQLILCRLLPLACKGNIISFRISVWVCIFVCTIASPSIPKSV